MIDMKPLRDLTALMLNSAINRGSTKTEILDRAITNVDINAYYGKQFVYSYNSRRKRSKPPARIVSTFLTDGKKGKYVEYPWGVVMAYGTIGVDTKNGPGAMDEIRFHSFVEETLCGMNFFLGFVPVGDIGKANSHAKEARIILKALTAADDINTFEKIFRKYGKNRRYSW